MQMGSSAGPTCQNLSSTLMLASSAAQHATLRRLAVCGGDVARTCLCPDSSICTVAVMGCQHFS